MKQDSEALKNMVEVTDRKKEWKKGGSEEREKKKRDREQKNRDQYNISTFER